MGGFTVILVDLEGTDIINPPTQATSRSPPPLELTLLVRMRGGGHNVPALFQMAISP